MKNPNFPNKSFVEININQETMTVFEFNDLVKVMTMFGPDNRISADKKAYIDVKLKILKPFRLTGNIQNLSVMASVYYRAFIREGLIKNLRVIK